MKSTRPDVKEAALDPIERERATRGGVWTKLVAAAAGKSFRQLAPIHVLTAIAVSVFCHVRLL